MNKKGAEGNLGLVVGLVMGIATLIIGIVIAFVLVSTLINSNIILPETTGSATVTNESFTASTTAKSKSISTGLADKWFTGFNATQIMNGSDVSGGNQTLVEGVDYNIHSTNGTIFNRTVSAHTFGYRATYVYTRTADKLSNTASNMSTNFSKGVDNISSKVPTLLLIGAIILIISILAVLVAVWQRMKLGGGTL